MAPRSSSLVLPVALLTGMLASLGSQGFAAFPAAARVVRVAARADGNLGGDYWAHPWAEELGEKYKDDISFDDVISFFNAKREEEGLMPVEGSPLIILEGIVTNAEKSGQPGMNKAQRIADGIQGSSFLLSELTE
eukprot:TRINITY_DN57057_c0_g1_i1.p1 TRINITY_DN57057_c0_g1~~TRINITY_DN57057_c0_g1_i1.p1  ORF type:complete len:135 (+),score=35.56 TRINITY_DN57057_c0_g1_i1:47-451(+)